MSHSDELEMLMCDTIHIYPSLETEWNQLPSIPTTSKSEISTPVQLDYVQTDIVLNTVYSNFTNAKFKSEEISPNPLYDEVPVKDELPAYYQHEVDHLNDNLQRLTIMYHVEIDEIKAANGIYSPGISLDFYTKKYITIPGPKRLLDKKPQGRELEEVEQRKKHWAMEFFIGLKGVPSLVAKCYLEVNEYDFKKAIKEYEADLEWDLNHKERKENKVEKKQAAAKQRLLHKLRMKYPIMGLLTPFACCFSLNYLQTIEMDEILDQ
jgi:hypothetical protein